MNRRQLKEIIKKDLKRNGNTSFLRSYLTNNCVRVIVWYRICKYFEFKNSRIFALFQYYSRFHYNRICMKYGCDIPSRCSIGPGLAIAHSNGIVINERAIIGRNFTIRTGCVIGETARGIPFVGNNVTMGAHSMILGCVTVEDFASIGAGAIVTHDVPVGG